MGGMDLNEAKSELQACRRDKLEFENLNSELDNKLQSVLTEKEALKRKMEGLESTATKLDQELTTLRESFSKCERDRISALDLAQEVVADNERIIDENSKIK